MKRGGYLGFTIVELLVVITIIGVLAAITVVAYSGIQQKAVVASLTSDLDNAAKLLKLDQVINSTYPASLGAANGGKGVPASNGVTYQYAVSTSPQAFCITATKGSLNLNINQDSAPIVGSCPVLRLDAGNTLSYPGSGTSWNDISGNGGKETLGGGVSYTNDGGGAFSFDGVDDNIYIPYAAQFNIRNAITLSVWIKRTSGFNQLQDTMILGRPPVWYFYDSYNSGTLHGDVYIDGVRQAALDASVPYDSKWYQITYTYDSAKQTAIIYRNGASVGSITLTGLSNYLIDSSTADFSKMGLNTAGRTMSLNDARVYNYALSADEISQNFNNTRNRYGL